MAIAVDTGNSPIRFTGTIDVTGSPPTTITSAAFTAPAGSLIVCCVQGDSNTTDVVLTISDSGGLTWTKQVERQTTETTSGGMSALYTAPQVTSSSRTVSVARVSGGGTGSNRYSAKVYVVTGYDTSTAVDTVTASNEGGSTTNNFTTTSITAGANGLLICADTDWTEKGLFTSSDLTIDTADYSSPSQISVMDGYKSVTSGASVNGNLNAGGTASCQHKWCQIIVREAASGRTTKNTRGWPLGTQIGMGWRMPA